MSDAWYASVRHRHCFQYDQSNHALPNRHGTFRCDTKSLFKALAAYSPRPQKIQVILQHILLIGSRVLDPKVQHSYRRCSVHHPLVHCGCTHLYIFSILSRRTVQPAFGRVMASFVTESARWRALVTRDPAANGHFIYAIKSTKIYCRPTCPGRLARRANIDFYVTASQAEAAGFRACKRCKPNTVLEDPQEVAVKKACSIIEDALHKDDPEMFKLQELAKMVGLTPRYFHKIFKDKTGMTPKEYAKSRSSSSSPGEISVSTAASTDSWDWNMLNFNTIMPPAMDENHFSMIETSINRTGQPIVNLGTNLSETSFLEPWCTDSWRTDMSAIVTTQAEQVMVASHPDTQIQLLLNISTTSGTAESCLAISDADLGAMAALSPEFPPVNFLS